MASDPYGPLLFLFLTLLAACVHAAETALPFLDGSDWEKNAAQGDARARRMLRLAEMASGKVDLLQSAHMTLLLAAGVTAAARFAGPLSLCFSEAPGPAARFLAGLAVFLIAALAECVFAVLAPQLWAASRPEQAAGATSVPAALCARALSPLALLCDAAARTILRLFRVQPGDAQEHVTEEEIRMMVDIGEEKGTIEADEKEMIQNIFDFSELTAEDCMIHRKDVTAIDIEDSPEDILNTIRESGLSRFPVYEGSIDNVIGVLFSRDYLLNACSGGEKSLRDMIRPAYFAPASMRTDDLFREMQAHKQHMAIVVDEYGGTGGLVTLEDLLEEIVGNIYDEFDPQAKQDITLLPDGRYRVSGSTELETLAEALDIEFPEDMEFDTLSGLVFGCLTEIPADGERPVVEQYGLRISVEEILDRRVEWAIVEKLAAGEPEEEAAEKQASRHSTKGSDGHGIAQAEDPSGR